MIPAPTTSHELDVRPRLVEQRRGLERTLTGADDEHRLTVVGRGTEQPVAGDRNRLIEAGAAIGDGIGQRVQHGCVGQHLVAPPASEVLGEAERTTRADDPTVEVEAGGSPSPCTVGARRVYPAGGARDTRVNGNPRALGVGAVRPRLDHPPGDLVSEHGVQGGRGSGVVREQVEIAAADPAGCHRDAGPCLPGELRLGKVHERRRE